MRPPGFEPGIAGLGDMQPTYKNNSKQSGNSQSDDPSNGTRALGILLWPDREAFRGWLAQRVHPRTLRDYMLYYDRLQARYPQGLPFEAVQELARQKWPRYVIRKVAQYLWATGRISLEERARIEFLARAPKSLEAPRAPRVTIEQLRGSLGKLRDARYRLAYLIMYYSGARVEEAVRLIQIAGELEEIPREQALRSVGYVRLGKSVRVAMHFNRGRKRCDFLWLPAWLFEMIRAARFELNARALSTYARKHGAMAPKLVRKLHYQLMEELEIDKEIRDLIQNRPGGLSVGDIHYSRILERADEWYEHRILPFLEERLGLVRG